MNYSVWCIELALVDSLAFFSKLGNRLALANSCFLRRILVEEPLRAELVASTIQKVLAGLELYVLELKLELYCKQRL